MKNNIKLKGDIFIFESVDIKINLQVEGGYLRLWIIMARLRGGKGVLSFLDCFGQVKRGKGYHYQNLGCFCLDATWLSLEQKIMQSNTK